MKSLSLSRRRSSARNVPAAKSGEKRMFSQATLLQASNFLRFTHLEPLTEYINFVFTDKCNKVLSLTKRFACSLKNLHLPLGKQTLHTSEIS